jgi:hypothetical protein
MKIRMTTNSIRLRLRKSDIADLQKSRILTDEVAFPSHNTFSFAISITTSDSINASFTQSQILISIPTKIATHWIESNEVGIETHLAFNENNCLHILIEKDFPCLDREEENKEDTFWELSGDEPKMC